MSVESFDAFVESLMSDSGFMAMVKEREQEDDFRLLCDLIALRRASGLSREDISRRMNSDRRGVAYIEKNLIAGRPPSVLRLRQFAKAINHRLEIRFVPCAE